MLTERRIFLYTYVEVLEKLTPLFFALDHVNFSRWVPVHIRDMKALPSCIRDEFENQGHWVLSKTNNKFSAMPIDQAHEQENTYVKGSGGCVGLTENPGAVSKHFHYKLLILLDACVFQVKV